MTKIRPPASFADAVTRIAGRVGWEAMADATGKTERAVRHWSDPDMDRAPSIADALALDALFLKAGGGEPPLMAVYQAQLERAQAAPADRDELASLTGKVAKEAGEAVAAAVSAVASAGSVAERILADRELGEAIDAMGSLRAKLAAPDGVAVIERRAG